MSVVRIQTGATEPIEVFAVDSLGVALTGLTDLYVRIRRASDGKFLDWADMTFKSVGWTTLNKVLAELNATNAPGLYGVTGGINTGSITNVIANDTYTVYPLQTPGTTARLPGPGQLEMGSWADKLDAAVSTRATQAQILSDATPFPGARIDAAVSSNASPGDAMALTPTERAAVVDAVWDEAIAGHVGVGTTGKALQDAGAVSDPAVIAAAVWNEPLAGHVAPGSAGQAEGRLDVAVSTRAAPGAAMALTAGAVDASAVDTSGAEAIRDAILSDGIPFQGARIDSAISSRAAPGDAMDLVANAVDANAVAATGAEKVAEATWDEPLAGHATPGTAGEAQGSIADVGAQVEKIDGAATVAPSAAVVGSLLDRLTNKDGSRTYNQTTDSLEAVRDRIG